MDSEYYEVINKNYEKILKENEELKNKVRELSAVKNTLMAIIEHKDKTIEELLRENAELKLRIAVLEKTLNDTKKELEDTKQELEKTKQDLAETKVELTTVKDNINKIMNNTLYKKIIMGIQDYNAIELLEKKLSNPTELQYLRDDRVDECHYINKKQNPSQQEKDIKINILIDKINTAPKDIIDMFENMYPGLIQLLIAEQFLDKRTVIEDERIIKRANAWWTI